MTHHDDPSPECPSCTSRFKPVLNHLVLRDMAGSERQVVCPDPWHGDYLALARRLPRQQPVPHDRRDAMSAEQHDNPSAWQADFYPDAVTPQNVPAAVAEAEARGYERGKRDALTEAAAAMGHDLLLFATLEALCESSTNPSPLADEVQDAAVAWLRARAAETPGGAA